MEVSPRQPSTDPLAVQLNGELRQVIESLRLLNVLLSLEDGTLSDHRDLVHDKYLTALIRDKKPTILSSLKGLTVSFKALSNAVNDGKLAKLNDAMKVADENLSILKSVVIGVHDLLQKEYKNVKATKRRQGWNFLLTLVLGAGMGWFKLALPNSNNFLVNVCIPSQSNSDSATSPNSSSIISHVQTSPPSVPTALSEQPLTETDSSPNSDMNDFLCNLLSSRWTTVGFVAWVAIYVQQAFSSYFSLHRRTELLRRHEFDAARVIEAFKQNGDKGKLEALTHTSLNSNHQFSTEGKLIVMSDCADIEVIIQSIREWVSR